MKTFKLILDTAVRRGCRRVCIFLAGDLRMGVAQLYLFLGSGSGGRSVGEKVFLTV